MQPRGQPGLVSFDERTSVRVQSSKEGEGLVGRCQLKVRTDWNTISCVTFQRGLFNTGGEKEINKHRGGKGNRGRTVRS